MIKLYNAYILLFIFYAAIIAYRTKKVIFLGIRNKFCCMCARSKNEIKEHKCWKNWNMNDSSTGMETSIVVEGFRNSEKIMD